MNREKFVKSFLIVFVLGVVIASSLASLAGSASAEWGGMHYLLVLIIALLFGYYEATKKQG